MEQIVQGVLVETSPHGAAPAAEGVQRPAEPLVGEGLYQIVHHPQPGQCLHGGGIVGGGDHDHVGLHPGGPHRPQKFQPVHLGHVESRITRSAGLCRSQSSARRGWLKVWVTVNRPSFSA